MRLYQGNFVYDTVEELNYALMNAMDFSVRSDGVIIDKTIDSNGTIITMGDKMLKVNIDPRNIHYAGEKDVLFEPLVNLNIIKKLYGLFLDKLYVYQGKEVLSSFTDEEFDQIGEKQTSYGVKFRDGTSYHSQLYYSRCLGLLELIFLIAEENVYLRNFDVNPLEMNKLKKLEKDELKQKLEDKRKSAIVIKKVRKPRKKKEE